MAIDPIRNWGFAYAATKIKRIGFDSPLPFSLQIPLSLLLRPFALYCPELAHTTFYPAMFSSHLTPAPEDVAYEEITAQLATYSRGLFEFTLRLWSESRKRAEEVQRLEESAASLDLSRPPQARTGSVRSAHEVDANSQ